MLVRDEPKIDCHCHVIDPARFPYQPGTRYAPSGQEIAPVDQFLRVMALYGVRHALIVGTNSGYGEDSSPVLDALERHGDRFKGVAVVDQGIDMAELTRLRAAGIIGVAFNPTLHGTAHYAGAGTLLGHLAELGMFLQVQAREDQLPELLPLIERSAVRLVIDHCGRPAPERGLDQPGFRALLKLGRASRATVKLSGFSQFSRERHPYPDVRPFVDALLDAFTPDRCVWGSDWPFLRAKERIDYGPLLELAATLLPGAVERQKVFWDTPRRLFGFEDASQIGMPGS